jgi:hypothetical protein
MDSRDRRGQLILVAAFGLAVAFVVLALVLNSVVFTENLATRNHDRADDAVGFQNAVEGGVGGLLTGVNDHNNSDYDELRTALHAGLERWDLNTSLLAASDGRVTETTVAGVEKGTQVIQSERKTFTNETGAGTWTLAPGVDETRRFRMLVSQNDSTNPFRVQVADGSNSWTVRVEENGTNTDVTVLDDGTPQVTHTEPGDTVEIDLTQGTVNGTEVANWTFAEGVAPGYDINYENGDTATGRYVFVVDRPRVALLDDLPRDTYFSRTSGDYPTTAPAIYSANVSVLVLRSTLTYETHVEVAPGSPPAEEDYAVGNYTPRYATDVLLVNPDTGNLLSISRDRQHTFDASNVSVLGPRRVDFDGDGRKEVSYVTTDGDLRLIDAKNRSEMWRTSSDPHPPEASKARLDVGAWNGSEFAVLYANDAETELYAAENASGPSTRAHYSDDGVGSVAGVADIDGDGADELVFGDASQQLRYVEPNGTEVKIPGGGYGTNNAAGIGTPRDFDGDGKARVPFVDGSSSLKLTDASGNVTTVIKSTNQDVDKTHVTATDWDDDGELEIMFVSGGKLYYADNVLAGGNPVKVSDDLDGDGTAGVDVDTNAGVA